MPNYHGKSIGPENYLRVQNLIEGELTAREIAQIFDVHPETIRKFARRRGLTISRGYHSMEQHPQWRGGTVKDSRGYLLQRVRADGPHGYLIRAHQGYAGGYAPVHRVVMHDKLGRPLRPGEVVDHIDGDIENNDPENLRVFGSNSEHLKWTLKGKRPNWTEEGFARMCAPRPHRRRSDPES